MFRPQLKLLTELAADHFEKARHCTKAADAQVFTELGLRCLEQASAIAAELRSNSIFLYIECCGHLGKKGDSYSSYLQFCARNNLDMLSEPDFNLTVQGLGWL